MDEQKINAHQIKKIHTLKSALRISDTAYRDIMESRFKVTTSKELNFLQANAFISDLEGIAVGRGVWGNKQLVDKYADLNDRPGMANSAQLRMVEGMWNELYPEPDDKRREGALRHYLSRFFKVSGIRFLDAETVNKVLYALKEMQARKKGRKRNAPGSRSRRVAV